MSSFNFWAYLSILIAMLLAIGACMQEGKHSKPGLWMTLFITMFLIASLVKYK